MQLAIMRLKFQFRKYKLFMRYIIQLDQHHIYNPSKTNKFELGNFETIKKLLGPTVYV